MIFQGSAQMVIWRYQVKGMRGLYKTFHSNQSSNCFVALLMWGQVLSCSKQTLLVSIALLLFWMIILIFLGFLIVLPRWWPPLGQIFYQNYTFIVPKHVSYSKDLGNAETSHKIHPFDWVRPKYGKNTFNPIKSLNWNFFLHNDADFALGGKSKVFNMLT